MPCNKELYRYIILYIYFDPMIWHCFHNATCNIYWYIYIWIFSCLKYIKCTINRFPGRMLRAVSYIHSFLLSFWIQTCARELMFAGTNTSMLQHLMLYRFRNYVAIYSVIVLLKYHVPMLNVFSNKTNLPILRYLKKFQGANRITRFYIWI